MADECIKRRIYNVLKYGVFSGPDDSIFISDGDGENIHVVVVSPQFEGRPMLEKEDLIWDELMSRLEQEDWSKVSLLVGVGPRELEAV